MGDQWEELGEDTSKKSHPRHVKLQRKHTDLLFVSQRTISG